MLKLKKNPDNEIFKITYKRYINFCSEIFKRAQRLNDSHEISKAGNNAKLYITMTIH